MDRFIATKSQLSQILGVSERSLSEWQKENPPLPILREGGPNDENRYDAADCVRWYVDRSIRKAKIELPRDRLSNMQANKTELEVAELAGELCRSNDVTQLWGEKTAAARAKLLPFPSKIAQRIATPERMAEVQAAAQEVVYEVLNELAGDGLPEVARARRQRGKRDLAPAAEADGQPVGRRAPKAKPRVKRGTRKVGDLDR